MVLAVIAARGLFAGRREFLVLEVLRLAATGFALVALWTYGALGSLAIPFLAALLAPLAASAAALPFVAGPWFTGADPGPL